MEPSGGEDAAKRAKPSSPDAAKRAQPSSDAGDDRLSALPDELLTLILLRLDTTAEAARTSVLSSRWRRVWRSLPELHFSEAPDADVIASLLAAHSAALRYLGVRTLDATSESVATWLPVAARRLSGHLIYWNLVPGRNAVDDGEEDESGGRGAFELPCFNRATKVAFDLGFLGLSVQPAGVFSRLTDLCLRNVRFRGPCELGDAISSPRCPSLHKLRLLSDRGLVNLVLHSKSLLQVHLECLDGLKQLSIDAPALEKLVLVECFGRNQATADISAPQLVVLWWVDWYDPTSIHLGNIAKLQQLTTPFFRVYGYHDSSVNHSVMKLLERFQVINHLQTVLVYPENIGDFLYMMDNMTMIPHVTFLTLRVINEGHAFGASLYHVLKLCTGIRRLTLVLAGEDLEVQSSCPPGCICDQPIHWKTKELKLNSLQEVELSNLEGAQHEVAFVERLFCWATVLKRMKITFDSSTGEDKVREFSRLLSSFSTPENPLEFCMYHDAGKKSWYLLTPEDQGTRA